MKEKYGVINKVKNMYSFRRFTNFWRGTGTAVFGGGCVECTKTSDRPANRINLAALHKTHKDSSTKPCGEHKVQNGKQLNV